MLFLYISMYPKLRNHSPLSTSFKLSPANMFGQALHPVFRPLRLGMMDGREIPQQDAVVFKFYKPTTGQTGLASQGTYIL